MERREFMHRASGATAAGLAAASGWLPAHAQVPVQNAPGWNKTAFDSHSLNEVVKSLGGSTATESKDVILTAPEIAENGNVVRVAGQSNLPGTTQIAFVVEKNPYALAAVFDVPAGTDANLATNVKMGQSSNVYALVKAGDKFYYAVKEVKVTLGGCGG